MEVVRDTLNKIITSKLDSLSEAIAIGEKQTTSIKNITYYGWVPNNSGMLRLERIAIPSVKGRISLLHSSCVKDGGYHKTIECIDTDLELRDDISSKSETIRDFWRIIRADENGTTFSNTKKLISFLIKKGWSSRTRPVLFTTVNFLDDNGNPVKNGEGHKVVNGKYTGEAILCFYHKKNYNNLFGKSFIGKNRFFDGIKSYYAKHRPNHCEDCCAEIDKFRNDLANALQECPPSWIYSTSYTIESRGKITLSPLNVYISDVPVDIDSLTTDEGYKHIMQMMYGVVKKVFHGDNHHHHKDDVILKVYSDERQKNIVLDNMASHLKGIEKVEIGRSFAPCHDFIPVFSNEAIGVQGYAQMYYKNYIEKEAPALKDEGERMLTSIDVLVKSLKSSSDRQQDQATRKKRKDLSESIFRNPSIWILLFSISTFLWVITGFSEKIQGENLNAAIANNIIMSVVCFLSTLNWTVFFILLFGGIIFFKQGMISKWYCYIFRLHSDGRPKDNRAAKYFDTSKLARIKTIILALIGLVITLFLIFSPKVDSFIRKYHAEGFRGVSEFYKDLTHCRNCLKEKIDALQNHQPSSIIHQTQATKKETPHLK